MSKVAACKSMNHYLQKTLPPASITGQQVPYISKVFSETYLCGKEEKNDSLITL